VREPANTGKAGVDTNLTS